MPISIEEFNNEFWFRISDYDKMRPFFMSIVSDSNHWMFISSNGGLTAGRKNAEYALFPYYTDDKLQELAHTTGSKSIFRINEGGKSYVWEPFSEVYAHQYRISRNIYKNRFGNKILFEEVNQDLGLTFRYEWNSSNLFGFVRKAELINSGNRDRDIEMLDGIQNILPYGVNPDLQTRSSNLLDAYKRSELVEETGLGVYALSAIPVDKAEPSEALKANVAWSAGLPGSGYLLSSLQLDDFREGKTIKPEKDIKGEKGAYFLHAEISLTSGDSTDWDIIANVNQDHANVMRLNEMIREDRDLRKEVSEDVERGTLELIDLVAGADGLQQSSDAFRDTRHYSNVLFNIMRGGTFDHNYQVEKRDFTQYLETASRGICDRNREFIDGLQDTFDKNHLKELLSDCNDPDLIRLGKEYLPLKFSRRHGDPSRPWNKFSINTHDETDGSKILDYEGNWRDIFQNWEALVHSYPDFVEGMIFKFLNASTFDGYNPYRVTKDGFDWETIEPDDPWSYIGYWGDHQIIYLLKFLEFYEDYKPEGLKKLFDQDVFVYANVPYRIRPYEEILKDPKDTIIFDEDRDHRVRQQVDERGADGALLNSKEESIHRVNFTEKILATVLSKISNFIPEAGIWMNTQRPEWNDANNALVGNGVSMVTLCYLRRFLNFYAPLLRGSDSEQIHVSDELKTFFTEIHTVLQSHRDVLSTGFSDSDRKAVTDGLGQAGSAYREKIYDNGFSGQRSELSVSDIADLAELSLEYMDQSIRANKRDDDLYHAYNLMTAKENEIEISYLEEMLEGQVAVLSSGLLKPEESLSVLKALRNSSLYREDQHSYILYPNKELKGFLERNYIPEEQVKRSELLQNMVSEGDRRIVSRDVKGGHHFNGNFKNARDLKDALKKLGSGKYADLARKEEELILDIFEQVFDHKSFTGRSGTFYGYEGLGSIYWHMVSKLYLAAYEVCEQAYRSGTKAETTEQLAEFFDEIGEGIGIHKSPELYGAFPTDPYSHTPWHRGAQQPGMTGQVKEDILARLGQLGVTIRDGKLSFDPFLLRRSEFTEKEREFRFVAVNRDRSPLALKEETLAFTCCQVPVVYTIADREHIEVRMKDDSTREISSIQLDDDLSGMIFDRSDEVQEIMVSLKKERLR